MSGKKKSDSAKKIVFVGTTNVGKTSIIGYIKSSAPEPAPRATSSLQVVSQMIQSPYGTIVMNFWDTAGQERFKGLGSMYYKGSSACVAVFDVTQPSSLDALKDFVDMFASCCPSSGSKPKIVIAANKIDLLNDEEELEAILQRAGRYGYKVVCTSAFTGVGIKELIKYLSDIVMPEPKETIDTHQISLDDKPPEKKKCC